MKIGGETLPNSKYSAADGIVSAMKGDTTKLCHSNPVSQPRGAVQASVTVIPAQSRSVALIERAYRARPLSLRVARTAALVVGGSKVDA